MRLKFIAQVNNCNVVRTHDWPITNQTLCTYGNAAHLYILNCLQEFVRHVLNIVSTSKIHYWQKIVFPVK